MSASHDFSVSLMNQIQMKTREEVDQLLLDTCLARNNYQDQYNKLVNESLTCQEKYDQVCDAAIRFHLMSDPTIVDVTDQYFLDTLNSRWVNCGWIASHRVQLFFAVSNNRNCTSITAQSFSNSSTLLLERLFSLRKPSRLLSRVVSMPTLFLLQPWLSFVTKSSWRNHWRMWKKKPRKRKSAFFDRWRPWRLRSARQVRNHFAISTRWLSNSTALPYYFVFTVMQAKLNNVPIQNNKIAKVTQPHTPPPEWTVSPLFRHHQASSSTKKLAINDGKPPAGIFYLHPQVPFIYVRVYIVVTYAYLQGDRVMKELTSTLGSINLDSDCDDDSDNNGGSDLSSLDWVNRLFFFMASNESSFWVGFYF